MNKVILLLFKIVLFAITLTVFLLISVPHDVCWDLSNAPKNVPNVTADGSIYIENEKICIKTALFKNFMCAGDPWEKPWWNVWITDWSKFCIARTSTYTAMFIQLCLVCIVQLLHLFFLAKRSFVNYDPLDMIPAFFTICALSSVLVIQTVLSTNWNDLWAHNNIHPPPSSAMPHTALTSVLSTGILIAAIDWILYHRAYSVEQDLIEERAKATNNLNASPHSDKEHED